MPPRAAPGPASTAWWRTSGEWAGWGPCMRMRMRMWLWLGWSAVVVGVGRRVCHRWQLAAHCHTVAAFRCTHGLTCDRPTHSLARSRPCMRCPAGLRRRLGRCLAPARGWMSVALAALRPATTLGAWMRCDHGRRSFASGRVSGCGGCGRMRCECSRSAHLAALTQLVIAVAVVARGVGAAVAAPGSALRSRGSALRPLPAGLAAVVTAAARRRCDTVETTERAWLSGDAEPMGRVTTAVRGRQGDVGTGCELHVVPLARCRAAGASHGCRCRWCRRDCGCGSRGAVANRASLAGGGVAPQLRLMPSTPATCVPLGVCAIATMAARWW